MNKTKFTKELLTKSGPYLLYGPNKQFVARFKYSGGPVTLAKFKKELIANHFVEDYFSELNDSQKAPLHILRENNPTWYENLKSQWLEKHH